MEQDVNKYNRVILIGNGFDLSMGLKTSYSDFVLHLFKDALKQIYSGNELKSDFFKARNKVVAFTSHRPFLENLERCTSLDDLKDLEDGKVFSSLECKDVFFKKIVNHFIDYNWVDIENLYYKDLRLMHTAIINNITSDGDPLRLLNELNHSIDLLTKALTLYLQKQVNKEPTMSFVNKSTSLLSDIFKPMRSQDYETTWSVKNVTPADHFLFLNFNYTSVLTQALEGNLNLTKNTFKVKVNHIHGKLDSINNPPIFGYGDDTNEEYVKLENDGRNELLQKIKSFQYPRTRNYHNFLGFIESAPYEVFVVGHSCGLSDKTLLQTLFEHRHCMAIKNFHYQGEEEDFNKRMSIARIFTDKTLMRRLVLPFDETAKM
ncbi:MAG: hypothetical protein GQ574_17375 [Crocinitomix sp.]|nr:hypothetical protein [Crocinitomix sp.]